MNKAQRKRKRAKKKTGGKPPRHTRLEKATAAYFASLSGKALEEENHVGAAIGKAPFHVNFHE